MANNWVVYNAQGRRIGSYASPEQASTVWSAQVALGLVTIEYKPRKVAVKREYPYVGTHRL